MLTPFYEHLDACGKTGSAPAHAGTTARGVSHEPKTMGKAKRARNNGKARWASR